MNSFVGVTAHSSRITIDDNTIPPLRKIAAFSLVEVTLALGVAALRRSRTVLNRRPRIRLFRRSMLFWLPTFGFRRDRRIRFARTRLIPMSHAIGALCMGTG
jgi:hypothetical protein